jgi:hypothetical protein
MPISGCRAGSFIVLTAALLRLSASKSNERRNNIMAEKFALITGASSGIGFSVAEERAGSGMTLQSRRPESACKALQTNAGVQVIEIQTAPNVY